MQLQRRIFILIAVLAAALAFGGCAKYPPQPAEHAAVSPLLTSSSEDKKVVVVKVNGTAITRFALVDMMNRMIALNQRVSTTEPLEVTRRKALNQLVLQELAIEEANRQGIVVDDPVIDKAMLQFITRLGHEEGYRDYLEKQHSTTTEFRAQVERSLLVQLILMREVVNKASVSEEEKQKEYDAQRDQYRSTEKYTIVDIAVPLQQAGQGAPSSRDKANEILAKITSDGKSVLENLPDDGSNRVSTREIEKDKEPVLFEAAAKLKPGELSGIIEADDAIHIIKLISVAPGKQLSFDEAKGRIEGKLKLNAQLKRRQEWEQALLKNAQIEFMDPGDLLEHTKP